MSSPSCMTISLLHRFMLMAMTCLCCLPLAQAQTADSTVRVSDLNITRERFDNPVVLIETDMGNIVAELFPGEAPRTVETFLGLAEGTLPFTDPDTGAQAQRPFYDGLLFHRVIDGFMIQTGSPTGEADGDPGFNYDNEINARSLGLDRIPALDENGVPHAYLGVNDQREFQQTVLVPLYEKMGIETNEDLEARVDEVYEALRALSVMDVNVNLGYGYNERYPSRMPLAGVLALAHAGPGTNGSQFFITLADTPWLAGKYTVFGKVRSGMDIASQIGRVRVDNLDRPLQDVRVVSIRRIE